MIHLIDLSSNQAPSAVNALRLKAAGIRGAHVRCGVGLRMVDGTYVAHRAKLSNAGIRGGAYHVVQPSQGYPVLQAQRAVELMNYFPPAADDLPLGVDVERNKGLTVGEAIDWAAFLKEYLGELVTIGVRYVVYANTSFRWALEIAGLGKQPWWQAEYHRLVYPTPEGNVLAGAAETAADKATKALAAGDQEGFRKYTAVKQAAGLALSRLGLTPLDSGLRPVGAWMHQFGGDANAATCAGVDGFCDRSVFLGTEEEFAGFTLKGVFNYAPSRPLGPALAQALETGGLATDIQAALKALSYYYGSIDGLLGPKSVQAIKDFQWSRGLVADGIVGHKTRTALIEALKRRQS